jgi:penicillin-binding protein 1A
LRIRSRRGAPRRRRRIRKLRLLALLLALFLLAGAAFSVGFVRAVSTEIPKLDPANRLGADDIDTVIYAKPDASGNKRVLAVLRGSESRVLVRSIDDVAPIMRQAIVSVEDRRFYEHDGVDIRGILRALWEDIRSKKIVEGGSTITQQFVKNAYIRNEQTIGRKVREAALAWQLEKQWKSKNRILLAYLNTIYFGNGAYGIQQAARTYFHKGAARLRLHEAALLAGLPADPARYDPVQHPREARKRRHFVLTAMAAEGKITQLDLARADAKPLPKPEDVRLPGTQGPAPYFVNYVKDQLVQRYKAHGVFGGGLRVTTTIDLGLQELARDAIEAVLPNPAGPAAALVAIDPRDGSVRVMFGGTNFRRSQFNLATQAERQPGSAFKPIVLATAFRQGISPETEFDSKPLKIDAGDRIWSVRNYEGAYLGRVDLWRAMVHSDNAVYAQLTQLLGPRAIVETARRLGIRTELDPYFSIGLGQLGVNPLDMARAYATIANRGRRVDGAIFGNRPRVIAEVEEVRSRRVRTNGPTKTSVLEPEDAAMLTNILEDVVRLGTGRRAALPGRGVAGKTGTTDHYGDAWFVGYTPQLVTAVWVGYPNELRSMQTEFDGDPVAGGTLPALIWKEFMTRVVAKRKLEARYFPPAPYLGSVATRVVRRDGWKLDNGFCPNTRLLSYFTGRGPRELAPCKPNEVTVPVVVGRSLESAKARLAEQQLQVSLVYDDPDKGVRPGFVQAQDPPGGFLSAGDTVRLWVATAQYGLVPNFIGSSYADAASQLRRKKVSLRVETAEGRPGTVVRQWPRPGIAIEPGQTVLLVVGE